jgi:hypothetical protein
MADVIRGRVRSFRWGGVRYLLEIDVLELGDLV